MLDKVPIDPQQVIKRESPFTDETDLILSLFEVRQCRLWSHVKEEIVKIDLLQTQLAFFTSSLDK